MPQLFTPYGQAGTFAYLAIWGNPLCDKEPPSHAHEMMDSTILEEKGLFPRVDQKGLGSCEITAL